MQTTANNNADINRQTGFQCIADIIEFIDSPFEKQPTLENVAEHVGLSSSRLWRLFSVWAGTSPERFLHYIRTDHAKQLLQTEYASSEGSHDQFVRVLDMTPEEYGNGGVHLTITYCFAKSPFGEILIAGTDKGITYLGFITNKQSATRHFRAQFPNATYVKNTNRFKKTISQIFSRNNGALDTITLHIHGTHFQLQVWEALLKIPLGQLTSYSDVARYIGHTNAQRAVGTAVGQNPVSYLIPCHRVIRSNGTFGHYGGGAVRKKAIIGWEAARTEHKRH